MDKVVICFGPVLQQEPVILTAPKLFFGSLYSTRAGREKVIHSSWHARTRLNSSFAANHRSMVNNFYTP